MAKSKEYTIKWEIELDATSKEEAAQKALEILRDPNTTALVFAVKEFDNTADEYENIDLEKE